MTIALLETPKQGRTRSGDVKLALLVSNKRIGVKRGHIIHVILAYPRESKVALQPHNLGGPQRGDIIKMVT